MSRLKLVANNNILTGNTTNSNFFGLTASDSSCGNTLTDNNTSSNTHGIHFTRNCNSNTLTNNTVYSNNTSGIWLYRYSNSNTLTNNTVYSNNTSGIFIKWAHNNTIYNNNFINNTTQAYVYGASGNVFNLPAPSGGNYWSDWTTPDINGDGFVDGLYVFVGGQDNLPWVIQDGWVTKQIEQLIDEVIELNLHQGISNSLDAKLDVALKALDDLNENNDVGAINALNAFINEVEAQRGNKIFDEHADNLIDAALAIINKLESS